MVALAAAVDVNNTGEIDYRTFAAWFGSTKQAERAKARRQADREEVVAALEKTSERSKGAVRSAQSSARSKRKQMLLAAREAWSADEGHALRVPVAPVEPPADGDGAASDSTGIASDLE